MNPLTQIKNTQKISAQEVAAGLSDNASWHAKYKDSAYVFAGGLGYELTEGDLLAVFAQYGEIMDVNLVRDLDSGKSKGFAFLAYEDQRSTVLAVDNLNGARVAGRIVRVDHVANYKRKKEEDEDERNAAREERGVCYAFQRGECTRGSACRFSHDEQRNSKTWGPKEELESKSTWRSDKHPGNAPRAENGQTPGYGFRKDEAPPMKGSMGPPRAPPGGTPQEEAPRMRTGGGGAALPWEGGLFSMLADNVDVKRSRKEDKGQKDGEGHRHEKRRGDGAGGREDDRGRSPKRHRGDRERHAAEENTGAGPRGEEMNSARAGDRERGRQQTSKADREGDGRSQRQAGEGNRRGRDDRPSESTGVDHERSSGRDSTNRRYSRDSPDRERNGRSGHGKERRDYDRSHGEEGPGKGRKDVSESSRRNR
ncbi:hypothetical protein KFL_002710060 [Klebsormidium nitens]|uniref:Uncharacterized protein n=1 Tax=Klebsormidium nitens TaxID=105231 RepID=A0A1Y1IAG5_KLENI|nr:hypothetical protein KFL_002710060 [Klebsormidium nitens]|eukprot:GAQ86111.1 hypothetical protein KFL_002710060 [Klebsormidium nitens]